MKTTLKRTKSINETIKVEILRISSVLMDFFYRCSQDSTYNRTPHALRSNDSRLNLTIPKKAGLENKPAFKYAYIVNNSLQNHGIEQHEYQWYRDD